MRRLLPLLPVLVPTPACADPVVFTKTVTIVSDPVGSSQPRSLPGAVAEYRTIASNPIVNIGTPVRNMRVVETLPPTVVLSVADLSGAGKGPVEFSDGAVLGLPSSGLTYTYSASSPTTDGLEFWNGTTWAYQPIADANGYDANVRAFRVTLGATFAAATSFRLRYRTRIR